MASHDNKEKNLVKNIFIVGRKDYMNMEFLVFDEKYLTKVT